ncbi:MAG TPA: LysE family translocator [Parvularculaceae bacterium]|nr:LysE family translocator [Parvularculaceae bacterium]
MSLDHFLAFVAATSILVLTPGPVVAFVVATTLRRGVGAGLAIVVGTTGALAIHMALVWLGLSTLLSHFGEALFWLKWVGAAYLFVLGLGALFAKEAPAGEPALPPARSSLRLARDGFLVAIVNPKPLIFYAAFFPLFIDAGRPAEPQLSILCPTFLVIAASLDSCWALMAARARPFLTRAGRWGNRISGGVLIAAAAGVASLRQG